MKAHIRSCYLGLAWSHSSSAVAINSSTASLTDAQLPPRSRYQSMGRLSCIRWKLKTFSRCLRAAPEISHCSEILASSSIKSELWTLNDLKTGPSDQRSALMANVIIVLRWPSAMQTMDLCVWLTAVIMYGINMCLSWPRILRRTREVQKGACSVSSPYTMLGQTLLGCFCLLCI